MPYWRTFADPLDGWRRVPCWAFCNENGKLDGLPMNAVADALWKEALMVDRQPAQSDDYLAGPVAVVTGDDDFLAAL